MDATGAATLNKTWIQSENQSVHCPNSKEVVPDIQAKPTLQKLQATGPCPILYSKKKRCFPLFLKATFRYLKTAIMSPPKHLFHKLSSKEYMFCLSLYHMLIVL